MLCFVQCCCLHCSNFPEDELRGETRMNTCSRSFICLLDLSILSLDFLTSASAAFSSFSRVAFASLSLSCSSLTFLLAAFLRCSHSLAVTSAVSETKLLFEQEILTISGNGDHGLNQNVHFLLQPKDAHHQTGSTISSLV